MRAIPLSTMQLPNWYWQRRAARFPPGAWHQHQRAPGAALDHHLFRRNQAQNVAGLNTFRQALNLIKPEWEKQVTFHSTSQYRCYSVVNHVAT